AFSFAQNLDRISMSSGGAATDEVNYVIGETFNFTIAGGDIVLETGSLGSESNTGGEGVFTIVQEVAVNMPMYCYPNPVRDILTLKTSLKTGVKINLLIYNSNGQIVYQKTQANQDELRMNLSNLAPGTYHLAVIEEETETINAVKIIKQ
ncbi:MAG TPA: T9SS type A sorting domain-containing protein, partial [Bacteroidales bacterium]|nr:T9SS type A sorting domain-containing protein [Bacteroidales bacterium]